MTVAHLGHRIAGISRVCSGLGYRESAAARGSAESSEGDGGQDTIAGHRVRPAAGQPSGARHSYGRVRWAIGGDDVHGPSLGDRPRKQNPAEAGFCRSAPSNSEGGSGSCPNAPLSPLVAAGSPKVRLWRCIGLCPGRIAGAVGFGDPITASRWCVPCQGVIPPVLRRVSARRSSGRSTSSPPPWDSRSHAQADESAGLGSRAGARNGSR